MFKGTLELLNAALLGKFSGPISRLNNCYLLPGDRFQICDMVSHHFVVLSLLLNECLQPLQGRPLQERCR